MDDLNSQRNTNQTKCKKHDFQTLDVRKHRTVIPKRREISKASPTIAPVYFLERDLQAIAQAVLSARSP